MNIRRTTKKNKKFKKKSLIKKSHKSINKLKSHKSINKLKSNKFKSKKSTKSKNKIRKLNKSIIENIVNDPSIFN